MSTKILKLEPAIALSEEQFFALCRINRDHRIERNAQGELIIMSPTGAETGHRNFKILQQLANWADQDGTGLGFDSSTGFKLPNGANRSPDAAWIRRDRWEALTPTERDRFAPLCPDFVIELRSRSDNLAALQAKLQEYIDNGSQLGWLIDRQDCQVYIYRPGQPVECRGDITQISADPELPGFILNLAPIW